MPMTVHKPLCNANDYYAHKSESNSSSAVIVLRLKIVHLFKILRHLIGHLHCIENGHTHVSISYCSVYVDRGR